MEDPLTPQLKFLTIFFYCIIPIIGWIVTIFIMRFYKLDKNTMRGLYKNRVEINMLISKGNPMLMGCSRYKDGYNFTYEAECDNATLLILMSI